MDLKHAAQSRIRSLHLVLMNRGLPERVGLYFHSLEEKYYDAFADMVAYFKDQGYTFVTPDQYGVIAGRTAFVSFDDNFHSWWRALPLFERLDVTVAFYVNTMPFRDLAPRAQVDNYFNQLGHKGERETLTTQELMDIARAGHTIGSHTHSHTLLTSLSHEAAVAEIDTGKIKLEAVLGSAVAHFSYPYGMRRHFNESLRTHCRDIGFRTVANAIPAMQHAVFDSYAIQRSVWHLDKPVSFNVGNLCIDGRLFHRLTGRSAVG